MSEGHPHRPAPLGEPGASATISIALYLVLTIVTLGLWNLYWNYRQMRECNHLLGRHEFSWPLWLFLTIVTCGLYHLYYQYKMGAAINEIQSLRALDRTEGLPVLSLVAALLGVGILADCIHQHELNRILVRTGAAR